MIPRVVCVEDLLPGSITLARAASNKPLYRRLGLAVIIAALVFAVGLPGFAQMPQLKRPQEETEEKPPIPKPVKKVKGPRAVALLQTTSSGKTTLIPVAILVDGKFYDASEYKADPVPMALASGTIYEVERTGSSQGLFTVNTALHSKAPGSPHPWVGQGSFLANGTQAATNTRKAEDVPRGINDSGGDAPPRLTRGSSAPASNSSHPAGSASSDAKTQPPNSSDKTSGSPNGSNTTPSATGSSDSAPKTTSVSNSTPDTKQKSTQENSSTQAQQTQSSSAKPNDESKPSAESQGDSNYYRPTLRRGKPTSGAPPEVEDEPSSAKPASTENATAANTSPPQLVPAISDEGGPDPRSYKFFWKPGEEEERRDQMQALAGSEVQAYVAALQKNRISGQPATAKKPAPPKAPSKPVQPQFENIHFQGFDVWSNNQPVMVFTAEAHMPAVAGSTSLPGTYNVTLVARTDIYGDLRKIYSGVTDRFHLDVTPKLELIDVVDADGDGRGELLFNETTDTGSGYVIYRATADKLWKLFDSLGGGA